MKKNNKGFTLIELLGVVVIISILLAIALMAISRYIEYSRIKSLVATIDGYVRTVEQDVLDGAYKFDDKENVVYAVPIECVPLEKGGKGMFGQWLQANDDYWAYVLVQKDSVKAKYIYGFTFKDSVGWGVYPITIDKLGANRSKVKTGLSLRKPETGLYLNVAEKKHWTGFNIDNETMVIVLESAKEGEQGNGETTCTLCQKGNNYDEAEEEKNDKLLYNIVKDGVLTGRSAQYTGKGYNTYKKNVYFYNDGGTNNILFANYCWKIIRTTDTGGVKLIYNGVPDDGTCNNVGSNAQIGRSEFNEYSSSLGDVGYMSGVPYEYEYSEPSGVVRLYKSESMYSYKYFSKNVTYSNGQYTLNSPIYRRWYDYYYSLPGYYTCLNGATTCADVFYITHSLSRSYAGGVMFGGGDLFQEGGDTITFATSVKKNASGDYVLQAPVVYDRTIFWNTSLSNYLGMYMCADQKSTVCDEVFYLYRNSGGWFDVGYEYFSSNDTFKFGKSFTYSSGKYTLKDTIDEYMLNSEDLNDYHYTCFNASGKCDEIYYIYAFGSGSWQADELNYYLILENGKSIDTAINEMLTTNLYDSNIKSIVDEWYVDNMTDYTSKLEDTVYCNNRSISTLGGWSPNSSTFEHLKFYSFNNNDLTCSNKADQFTMSSSIGNGKLDYPVGLITAPEAKMWGDRASGASYWTMSSFGYGEAAGHNFKVFEDGRVDFDRVTYSNGIRPVISLRPEIITIDGDGTAAKPYVVG